MASPIAAYLEKLRARLAPLDEGAVADYIPELANARPEWFGIALATTGGATYAVGDADIPFTIQSVSKPFAYGDALARLGREAVMARVGVEPTGEAFNSIVLDEANNRPFNPMVNAGAIAVSALFDGDTPEARRRNLLATFARFAGRRLNIDEAVFRSEDETGHRNRAIAYMMLNTGMIARPPAEALDVYFRQCAIAVTCRDLAVMAATLANDGVNPLTGETALGRAEVRDVLTVMSSCGMYDYAGQWAFEVGVPAKSGVSGAIIAVAPGQMGLAVFSPPLDRFGNSVRGIEACKAISEDLDLHVFASHVTPRSVIRRDYRGDAVRSRRRRAPADLALLEREGGAIAVLELQDALHFAAAERLIGRIEALAGEARFVILDFRRAHQTDAAAIALLTARLADRAAEGPRLILTGLDPDGPLAALRAAAADLAGPDGPDLHADLDAALEWCEAALLEGRHEPPRLALAQLPLFEGLATADLRLLEPIVETMRFEAGETIIRAGDPAQLMFVLAEGSVSVVAPGPSGEARRIAALGPGVTFGDMALLEGRPRSATVVADTAALCYAISVARLREVAAGRPGVLIAILGNLARELSERLRLANRIVHALD